MLLGADKQLVNDIEQHIICQVRTPCHLITVTI